MKILGAVLAGGRSKRFGGDKALALWKGRTLLERAGEGLRPQVDELVICGREAPHGTSLPDGVWFGQGPLAGLNSALRHARVTGFDAVLCVPVDVHPVPSDLRSRLGEQRAAVLASQWSIGFWPAELADLLEHHLEHGHRSLRSWIRLTCARMIDDRDLRLRNVNTTADLLVLDGD